jgi:hypothetical protein
MKLLIMQFPPISRHFIPFGPNILLLRMILKPTFCSSKSGQTGIVLLTYVLGSAYESNRAK